MALLEILLIVIVIVVFIFSASFRSAVSKTTDAVNQALEDFNDDWEESLREIRKSLPKSIDKEITTKEQSVIDKAESKLNSTQKLLDDSRKIVKSEYLPKLETPRDMAKRLWIKDFFIARNITKLIHFTDSRNLNNILENGLLSRDKLDKRGGVLL